MTNKEASKLIVDLSMMCEYVDEYSEPIDSDSYFEAVNMAVDALKSVKCKYCKHCEIDDETGYAYCDAWQRETQVDWFCSRGKQKWQEKNTQKR